jgi:hypothetical protein
MRVIYLVAIAVVVGLLLVVAVVSLAPGKDQIPVNGPPSKDNPRPIDLNTGKYLDEEGYNVTEVDWPYSHV